MEATGCRIIRYGKRDAEFSIYDVADVHFLNRGFLQSKLEKDLSVISHDPYALFFEGGDYADWIAPTDPRFDIEAVQEIKLSQIDPDLMAADIFDRQNGRTLLAGLMSKAIVKTFSPVRRKCLGFLMGNHEWVYMTRKSEMAVHAEICRALKVQNMGFSGWCDLYFVHVPGFRGCHVSVSSIPPQKFTARLRCFVHHGMGAANTAGGKINKLKQLVDMVEADLVMMGHVHEQFAKAFLRLEPNHNCTEIGQKITMGLITGSYLRTYAPGFTGYGEVKGYFPTTLGATRAKYLPAERILTVENRGDGVGLKGNL
jgi:hypothetical protein